MKQQLFCNNMDSEKKIFKCHHCGNIYKTKKICNSHIRANHGHEGGIRPRNHNCNLCDSAFFSSALLKRHISGVHQGIRKHKCHLCPKSYKQSNKLSYHITTFHLGVKEHKCDSCKKSFTNKENLKIHQKNVHEGIKSFPCDFCDKEYG